MLFYMARSRDYIKLALFLHCEVTSKPSHTSEVSQACDFEVEFPCGIYNVLCCRVIDEIEDVVGDKELVEADDLDKLTYMHQVQLTPSIASPV